MASYLTYNNIIDILTDIANRHQQINTFYVGENWEIENDADILYPVLQVYPTLAKLPRNAYGEYKTIQINMNCKVVNLTRQDNENEQDIYSDMLQVSQDIINELNQNPYFQNSNVSILNDISINPLSEFNDDYTNGWEWELSFQLINNNTFCGLPFDPIEGISYNGPVSTGYTYTNLFTCEDLIGCPIIIETEDRLTVLESILFTSNQLLTGTVNYLSGTTYDITPLTYLIQGIVYNVPLATQVVLLTGDTLYDRIDVIYADISGNTGVLIGEPSDSPVKPIIDTLTQVEVTFVSIPANSTVPAGVTTTLVYNEFVGPPTEWTFSTNVPTKINANATNSAYLGTKSIRLSAATTTNYFEMSASTVFDSTTQNTIQFAIKNNVVWPTSQAIRLNLYSATGVLIGGTVSLINGAYGFSSTNLTSWQLINIPISAFAATTTLFSKIRFTVYGVNTINQLNTNIDYIRLVTGTPTVTAFPNWRYIKGDLATTIDATTPNNTLTISGGTNIGSRVTGTNTLVIDMDPNIRLTGLTATTISATTYQGLPISNNFYTTGATISNNIAYFDRNDTLSAYTLNLSAFTSNDIYVTGGTYNPINGTTTLLRNDGGTVVVSGYYTGGTEYWTSGSTGLYSIKAKNDSALDATGDYSVAEGVDTLAIGSYSHSEGRQTTSSGIASHAEGQETIASGDFSHAEGYLTTASGYGSHAGGDNTIASGLNSFVHGLNSVASGNASIVLGDNLTGNTDNTTYVNLLNIKTIPVGTAINNLGVDINGDVIIGKISSDTFLTGGTYTAGTSTFRNNTGGTFNVTGYPTKTSDLFNDGDDGISHFISLNDLPSNIILYATTTASDIVGYFKLVSSINDPSYNTGSTNVSTGAITTTNQLISSLVTTPNIIVGNPGIFNITTIGQIRRTAGSGTATFYFEVYKRTSGGTETLIGTSLNTLVVNLATYVEFSASAIWNDGDFVTTDRIVLKFYGSRIAGGSNPTYQFQFGGNTPVRTLVPIPLAVIPSNYIFTGGTVTGPTNFTGGLTASTMSATTYYGDGSNLTNINIPTAAPAINLFNYYNNI